MSLCLRPLGQPQSQHFLPGVSSASGLAVFPADLDVGSLSLSLLELFELFRYICLDFLYFCSYAVRFPSRTL